MLEGPQHGRLVGVVAGGGGVEDAEDGVAVGHGLGGAPQRVDGDGAGPGLPEARDEREVGCPGPEFVPGAAQGAAR